MDGCERLDTNSSVAIHIFALPAKVRSEGLHRSDSGTWPMAGLGRKKANIQYLWRTGDAEDTRTPCSIIANNVLFWLRNDDSPHR
jgi:hypothetical protein